MTNRMKLEGFRRIILGASDILDLSQTDLALIRLGSQRQLCSWMQNKQNERCRVCKSGDQYDLEVFTQEPVNTIPLLFLWISNGRHCFDIILLYHYLQLTTLPDGTFISRYGRATNPLDRLPFTPEELNRIGRRYTTIYSLMQTVHDMII